MVTAIRAFDAKRDNGLIAAGGYFWCQGCLIACPLDDQSLDPRYCRECYDFLGREAKLLPPGKRPQWIPKENGKYQVHRQATRVLAQTPVAQVTAGIGFKTPSLGGRPLLDLPLDLIKELEDQGLKPREIHRQLVGKGTRVSIRTLYRVLAGQRVMA